MGHAFRKDYMEKMKRRYVKAQTRAQKDALIDETVAMCGLVRRGPSKEDQPPSCGGLAAEPKWISGRGKMDQGLRRGGSAAERGNEWDGLGEGRVKVLGVLGAPPPEPPAGYKAPCTPGRVLRTRLLARRRGRTENSAANVPRLGRRSKRIGGRGKVDQRPSLGDLAAESRCVSR